MSRLTKFIETVGKVKEHHESGSSYYTIGGTKVRVSNHLASINNLRDLMILLPSNSNKNYVVIIHGRIYTYESYTKIKLFLEHWIMLAEGFATRDKVILNDQEFQLRQQLNKVRQELAKIKQKKISLDDFTTSQQNTILNFLSQKK